MLNVNIFGSYQFSDLPNIPLADLTEGDVYGALQDFAAAESQYLENLMGQLCDFGTNVAESFGTISGGQLQRMGEGANPEATRRGGKYTVEFPIYAWGDKKLYTVEYLERASLGDLNSDAVDAAVKDINTMYTEVFRAFAWKDNYTFDDDPWPGERTGLRTIRRLANADGQTGSAFFNGNLIQLGTAQGYKTSGSAAFNYAAFTTSRDYLRATGNGADIVHVVSFNDAGTLGTNLGANYLRLPDPRLVVPGQTTPLVESPLAVGRIQDAGEVQAWPHWPDGYMFSFDRSKPKPVRIRQDRNGARRGFRLIADETAGGERVGRPLVNKMWQRVFGAAVRNRFNGVMMQITTGAYTNPMPS